MQYNSCKQCRYWAVSLLAIISGGCGSRLASESHLASKSSGLTLSLSADQNTQRHLSDEISFVATFRNDTSDPQVIRDGLELGVNVYLFISKSDPLKDAERFSHGELTFMPPFYSPKNDCIILFPGHSYSKQFVATGQSWINYIDHPELARFEKGAETWYARLAYNAEAQSDENKVVVKGGSLWSESVISGVQEITFAKEH